MYLSFQVELHFFAPFDYAIPDNHLVDVILRGLVLGQDIDKKLLIVPVEKLGQIGLQVEVEVSEI